jgi:hypothetical protein
MTTGVGENLTFLGEFIVKPAILLLSSTSSDFGIKQAKRYGGNKYQSWDLAMKLA